MTEDRYKQNMSPGYKECSVAQTALLKNNNFELQMAGASATSSESSNEHAHLALYTTDARASKRSAPKMHT